MDRKRDGFSGIKIVLLALLLATLACDLPFGIGESTEGPQPVTAAEGGNFSWPDLGELEIPAGTLEADTTVNLTPDSESPPMAEESPLEPAGPAYLIDLGGAKLVDRVWLHLALPADLPDPAQYHLIVRKITPGEPVMLMALDLGVDEMIFPVVGEGLYQMFTIPRLDRESLLAAIENIVPLNVPLYPQIASDWCSPTALTMLTQYHQGAWPAGGLGSKWGETSSWYLTGLAHQPSNVGNFFHTLMRAGGYYPPSDVHQSYTDATMEVMIWNWNDAIYNYDTEGYIDKHYSGETNMEKVEALYDAFRDYTESYLWGLNGPRKPLAWGSGMIAHSRVLTGSDGIHLYYNEPGNGSQNNPMTWEDHHAAVLASLTNVKEIIDTVVILGDPRPAEELRGSIWLTPKTSFTVSSLILREQATGGDYCYWYWDGSGTRNGYYFEDEGSEVSPCHFLPEDEEFDRAFDISLSNFQLDLTYYAFNIDSVEHDYLTVVEVYPNGGVTPIQITHQQVQGVPAHTLSPAITASLPLNNTAILGGRHVLKFTLWLDGILQDTKYVAFRIADYTAPLPAMPTEAPTNAPAPNLPTSTPIIIPVPTVATQYLPLPTIQPTQPIIIIPLTIAPITCHLSTPVLTQPSTTWTLTASPTLQWTYFSLNCWPSSYQLQIAMDANFTSIVVDESVTGGSFVPAGLQMCTKYYWRVAGYKDGVKGTWSDVWSFTPGDARQCQP